jgi:hypothetical protein
MAVSLLSVRLGTLRPPNAGIGKNVWDASRGPGHSYCHGSGSFDNGASSAEDENLLRWNLWVFGVPEAEGRDGDEAVDNASVYDGRVASGIQE